MRASVIGWPVVSSLIRPVTVACCAAAVEPASTSADATARHRDVPGRLRMFDFLARGWNERHPNRGLSRGKCTNCRMAQCSQLALVRHGAAQRVVDLTRGPG